MGNNGFLCPALHQGSLSWQVILGNCSQFIWASFYRTFFFFHSNSSNATRVKFLVDSADWPPQNSSSTFWLTAPTCWPHCRPCSLNPHAGIPSPILTIQVICRIKGMKHLFTPLGKSILGFIYSLKELQQLFFFFYFLILPVRHTYRFTKAKQ